MADPGHGDGIDVPVRTVLRRVAGVLADAGVPAPDSDATDLVAAVLGTDRGGVRRQAALGRAVDAEALGRLDVLVTRRTAREPLQHVLGTAPFLGLDLAVGPGVFVPRPETELVALDVIAALRDASVAAPALDTEAPVVVDLCSGSGALALGIADAVPTVRVIAVETDPDALTWLRRNVAAVPAGARVHVVAAAVADLLPSGAGAEVLDGLRGRVTAVVSNPPYLPLARAAELAPEVLDHDPPQALFGGPDGLDVVRDVVAVAADLLVDGGLLAIEHDDDHGPALTALLGVDPGNPDDRGWRDVRVCRDLADRPRWTRARRDRSAS